MAVFANGKIEAYVGPPGRGAADSRRRFPSEPAIARVLRSSLEALEVRGVEDPHVRASRQSHLDHVSWTTVAEVGVQEVHRRPPIGPKFPGAPWKSSGRCYSAPIGDHTGRTDKARPPGSTPDGLPGPIPLRW